MIVDLALLPRAATADENGSMFEVASLEDEGGKVKKTRWVKKTEFI